MDNSTASRLDSIIYMLTEFSRGNFQVREKVTDVEDPLNTVVAGLNMLGEELDYYKTQITDQRTFLQSILSTIDEVVYVRELNPDDPPLSRYTFISGRVEEIIGFSAAQLEQEPDSWVRAIHPEDKDRNIERFKKVLQGREIVLTYRSYHHITQQYRWIEDRISPKMNAEGFVTHIYGSARDVTEQQQTNLELEEKGELISRLITSSDQVFYIIELDKENPYKNTFTYLSAQIEKVIGYTIDDIRNDPLAWINAIHPDDVDNMKAASKEMFKNKRPATRIYRMKHQHTGNYVWLEDYVVPILDDKGWIREFYASARDITSRKNAEIEREKLIIELSKRHDELLQFNNIVSHNLRSPVASILGLARLLQNEMPVEEMQQTTAYILQAAHAMDDQLHDLNSILSTRSTLNERMEPFLLSDIIAAVEFTLKTEIEESNTTIDTLIDTAADKLISIKSYIQSAIFNLVSNAIKYRATDRPPVITIKVAQQNGSTIIAVADNGMGIDLNRHRNRLFNLYSRLNNDREGKGLGLYMTKTQIESLNGTLEVESDEGKGSAFIITL